MLELAGRCDGCAAVGGYVETGDSVFERDSYDFKKRSSVPSSHLTNDTLI